MNRSDIREEVRNMLKDNPSDTDLYRFSTTLLNSRINRIQEEMVSLTNCLKTRVTTAVVAGTQEYTLPSTFLGETQILFKDSNGVNHPLDKITETEMDLYYPDWRSSTNTNDPSTSYYLRRDKIGLSPIPSVSRASALTIDYIRRPDEMDDDTDIPFNGEYKFYTGHMGLVFGTVKLCLMDEGRLQEADKFEEKYAYKIKEIMKQISNENIDTRIINVYEISRHKSRRVR